LGWNFIDLDEKIELDQGLSIASIFDNHGELEFRRLESQALDRCIHKVQGGRPHVVSLGGGAFLSPHNFELVSNNGVSVWLDCPIELIERRIADCAKRPLARDPAQLRSLYAMRRDGYSRADYRIEIQDDDAAAAVNQILALPLF
jgi:shikimate kinase